MARRATTEDWAEAKRLFECGRSLKHIADTLDIDKASISKRAKNEAWEKSKFQPLIQDAARVRAEISTLGVEIQQTVEKEVEERLRHIDFFNGAAITNVKKAIKTPCENQQDHKYLAETILKGRETVLGKSPDTTIAINNAPAKEQGKSRLSDLVADYEVISES